MNEKINREFNAQMIREFYSAYLYLSMASYFDSVNLEGFASWMKMQAREEMYHGMKFYDFIIDRGGNIQLEDIKGEEAVWKSPVEVFEHTLSHEKKVTSFINDLVDMAIEESDHAANNFLQWFVSEQVEEESTADGILQKLKLTGKDSRALFMIDNELGRRVFSPPSEGK